MKTGICVFKRPLLPQHYLGNISVGDKFKYEYIGTSTQSARTVYKLTRTDGKIVYVEHKYFKMYMEVQDASTDNKNPKE